MNNLEVIDLLRRLRELAATGAHNMDASVDPTLAMCLGEVIGLIEARTFMYIPRLVRGSDI